MNKKIWGILFVVFISLITIFRLTHTSKIELTVDEAYFWEWSRHLNIAYSDQGPILGLVIFITTKLFNKISEFTVRFSGVIFGLGTTILVYLITKDIFRNTFSAFMASFILNIIPICSVGAMMITADVPMVFFWTLSLYFVCRAINSNSKPDLWWYLAGLSSALGIMSKYTMIFFIVSVSLFLLLSHEQKKLVTKKVMFITLLLSASGFIPVLIYNIKNNWATYGYIKSLLYSGESTYSGIQGLKGVGEYIGGQLGIVTPFLGLLFIYIIIVLFREGYIHRNDNFLLLFFCSVTILICFAILSFFSSVEENWTVPAYISITITTGGLLSSDIILKTKFWFILKRYIFYSIIFAMTITVLFHLQACYNIFSLPAWMDPADKARGWREMAQEVETIIKETPGKKFVLSNYYGLACELAFYLPGHPEIRCVDVGQRLREYRYWTKFDSLEGYNAVYVTQYPKVEPETKPLFHSSRLYKVINNYRDDLIIRRTYVYFCENFKDNYEVPKSPKLF